MTTNRYCSTNEEQLCFQLFIRRSRQQAVGSGGGLVEILSLARFIWIFIKFCVVEDSRM